MPFDGAGFPAGDRIEKLDAVTYLLSDPGRWGKGALTSHDGRRCIRGAMLAADAIELQDAVMAAIRETAGRRFRRIESFNDHPKTTHADMLAVLARARTYVLADQQEQAHGQDKPRLYSRFPDHRLAAGLAIALARPRTFGTELSPS